MHTRSHLFLFSACSFLGTAALLAAAPQEKKAETGRAHEKPTGAPKKTKGISLLGRVGQSALRKKRDPKELQRRYDKELKKPFVAKGNWITDWDEARSRAKREGKLIFAYFSRSYAP